MTEDAPTGAVDIDIRRGNPTEEEIAAVVAVVADAYASEAAALEADDETTVSVWQQNRRNMRTPLRRELGWGRFRG